MSEKIMRKNLIQWFKHLHFVPVENPIIPGTPDINYVSGWIELKKLPKFPVREDSIVKIHHYTPQQKLWIKKRHENGGKVFLLLQVKREWFLFKYPQTNDVGKLTKRELILSSHKYWEKGLNKGELELCLK